MQDFFTLFGPGAWIVILAAGYVTQPLVNVWKMTGVKSNYVPVCSILTGIVVVGLLQSIQGLAFDQRGLAAILLQGILAGLGAIGLTEVHKKAQAQKEADQAEKPDPSTPIPVNPFLPPDYLKALLDQAFTGGYISGGAPQEPPATPITSHQEGEQVSTPQYYDASGQPLKITRSVSVEGEPPQEPSPQPPQEAP